MCVFVWRCSPVMSTLCWCGPAACGGRSPSRGPTLSPWSRRRRSPPAGHRTGRSAPPPRGPWARVNTDPSRCPRRAVWRHESHWPPWDETGHTATQSQGHIAKRWTLVSLGAKQTHKTIVNSTRVFVLNLIFPENEFIPTRSILWDYFHNSSVMLWLLIDRLMKQVWPFFFRSRDNE